MKKYLLDSSFVIDLLNETAATEGPATAWLRRNLKARCWVSAVTLAEVLEGAGDSASVQSFLNRFSWQGIHRSHALRVALRQKRSSRRMGENDAWQVAVAEAMGATIVGNDDEAFKRLGDGYTNHRRGQ